MNKNPVTYKPIGIIHSEHTVPEATPIQPVFAEGCRGWAEVYSDYEPGLLDLERFSHIYLLYHFDRADSPRLMVKPFMQEVERGVFATRSPCRPNAVGLSVVRLVAREGNVVVFDGADILDGTPLLDIKPYTAKFDCISTVRNGWQDEVDEEVAYQKGRRGHYRPAGGRNK